MVMRPVTDREIKRRLEIDNPWWTEEGDVDPQYTRLQERGYFAPFFDLVTNLRVRRSVVLMGPRRVGKTVMLHQAIHRLIGQGIDRKNILFATMETPVYLGQSLEDLLLLHFQIPDLRSESQKYVFLDEIQYLAEWERHLKSLHDVFPNVRFVVSGSAAAALNRRSKETGAGRFTDFILPSLAFAEFLTLTGREELVDPNKITQENIDDLNQAFVEYINFGGYPELALSEDIQKNAERFVRSDILDKVLLRDLPSVYGIENVQELYHLFSNLSYNTGQEITLENLSQNSNISKNTLRRYLEYLIAAFLIIRVDRVDHNARRFKRATHFKIYLSNPSLRAALFGPSEEESPGFGKLVETAVFAQVEHAPNKPQVSYARWKTGEVDFVSNEYSMEIKWSDRSTSRQKELESLIHFANKTDNKIVCTTLRTTKRRKTKDADLLFIPTSVVALILSSSYLSEGGRNKHTFDALNRMTDPNITNT